MTQATYVFASNYQARYIPFFNVRQYTQINVYFIKEYGIVPIVYGCTEIRSQNDLTQYHWYTQTDRINYIYQRGGCEFDYFFLH